MTWRVSLHPVRHMTYFFIYSTEKDSITQSDYCFISHLPIVLSITTKHNFIPFFCMVARLENVAKSCMSYGTFTHGIAQSLVTLLLQSKMYFIRPSVALVELTYIHVQLLFNTIEQQSQYSVCIHV